MIAAVITFSHEGAMLAGKLGLKFPEWGIYLHENVPGNFEFQRFPSVFELVSNVFNDYSGLVFIGPCGIAVRSVAPHLRHKTQDPAVVVVDVMARWAISLVSGHEGGANDLALVVGNVLGAEPVISTTTEALKNLIVGVGCRKGISSAEVVRAVKETVAQAGLDLTRVRLLSSVDIKSDEQGLLFASKQLGIPLRFISSEEIRNCSQEFQQSEFVMNSVNLPAVAEPSALLAGRRTTLLVRKTIFNGVTIAVAMENCMSSV
ncbi:MAG: cobalt-precorrin 5A hydrolase [Desulfomonilaceae bacterium]